MLNDMLQWAVIRRRVLVDGVSKRRIRRETGMHWTTLEKILRHSEPPGYRADKPRAKPKLGPYLDRIARILEDERQAPREQRHTVKRIYQRLTITPPFPCPGMQSEPGPPAITGAPHPRQKPPSSHPPPLR